MLLSREFPSYLSGEKQKKEVRLSLLTNPTFKVVPGAGSTAQHGGTCLPYACKGQFPVPGVGVKSVTAVVPP